MDSQNRRWRFFRAGGFDQVRLDQAEELLAIGELDQKLWVALSCPVNGIQFDARTLAFIDSDGDGHVRAKELIAAVEWATSRLVDPGLLGRGVDGVTLADLRTDSEESQRIAQAARLLASDLGKSEGERLGVEEVALAQERHAARLQAEWEAQGAAASPLGADTEAAFQALQAVVARVDDFFLRCRLSAFDANAESAMNPAEDIWRSLAAPSVMPQEALAGLPLARVYPGAALPLAQGLNPAWAGALATLGQRAVTPLLGARDSLSEAEWNGLKERFSGYAAWQSSRPDPAARDDGGRDLERLVRYVRDLMTLANNFVSFKDFYTRQGKATFQAGTLYLDGRSCELCVAVTDPAKHALLATLSRICLVYCDCVRGGRKMTIAAAFTAGDSDQLMVGRNGIFYDRKGEDWDATIVKIIDHPISLRQAFWSPYKRLARMVGEQVQKFAASRAKDNETRLTQAATDTVRKGTAPAAPAPAPQPFDVGKFAGIFAAIGLAVGAIGTALASVLMGLLSLKWWQLPFAVAGVVVLISGPAVLLAWFKLRARNLGPILDANGWAINARACINIPFGTSLTQVAQLPPNAERSLSDPYAEKKVPLWYYVVFALLLLVVIVVWWMVRLLLH
ncbi:MAG: hypothetical protein KGL63_04450 [Betaproteobacteria bacterium]|nr:hypothetical protein [Betaproteobacteria bacterium]